ncbi:SNF1-related protein kinase regulatory subunit gamma-like PV42a [Prosopis cineraria]|uniref:SNF1-related protein kinase regulatory subunit gamma-like PV42a n=1 Tax=Prosopis cineraria TaxID=364024 RepID=UPI002410A08A|nr:SNF1-related protein kinase regulatory subunit gamma-like PV42a [Prosopis cineraria]
MQQIKEVNPTTMQGNESTQITAKKVKDLIADKKRRLVEVPYTASLSQVMSTLVENKVLAVPVAAPPGQWIGAGGSMIVETDKQTGTPLKHYIGIVTMLDIAAHIAGDDHLSQKDDGTEDLDQKMSEPVSSIIGHCLEGLNLWTLSPNTSLLDCMEVFSKGVHRALIPVDSQMQQISESGGVELIESSSGYQILTQMDVMKFLKQHSIELNSIVGRSVEDLCAVTDKVYAITERTRLIDAIRCLKASMLNAVPIINASEVGPDDHKQLLNGRSRKLIGTFSATDLRGCDSETLRFWLGKSALKFTELIGNGGSSSRREVGTCNSESGLCEVIDKVVSRHVHRVWVVDQEGLLVGVVSLSDIIRVIRTCLLSTEW